MKSYFTAENNFKNNILKFDKNSFDFEQRNKIKKLDEFQFKAGVKTPYNELDSDEELDFIF
ncbi:MAG: hypothetical protein GDA46_04580 [Bdellovibrionales bacterium]|nr:hypothetical protein [Bdellovibrionales bacterium]